MIDKDIKTFFELGYTTLYEWKKEKKGNGRKLLYEVLKSLPIGYIEKIKNIIEDKKNY